MNRSITGRLRCRVARRCLAPPVALGWLGLLALLLAAGWPMRAAVIGPRGPDPYMQDTPADTGVEPNPDTGPMYVSEDIWVRQDPIPGYQPYAFTSEPAWLTAISPLHENPKYRDPKFSKPNYVYVRVRNRGALASFGTAWLRVYWAKASTGLSWPAQWEDYVTNYCGADKLYGIEITKPRKNAATATAAERTAYINAVLGADTLTWVADNVSYFDKQDQVHELAADHGTAVWPWHREMINRYEILLRETDPTVTLLYWDWTTDPTNSTGGVDLMTSSFLGTANGVVGAPLTALHANGDCTNARSGTVFPSSGGVSCTDHPSDWTYAPPNLYRNKGSGVATTTSDATVLAPTDFPTFSGILNSPHGGAHFYLGGGGNLSAVATAAEDPMFFLLHANADRLWAMWQRDVSDLSRRDSATAYGTLTASTNMTSTMAPWDGSSGIPPWTSSAGDYTYGKTPVDSSAVDAPIYDTALLNIPILQSGESCVIEIPWYPPPPAAFSCFGSDQGHVCLLARIETSTSSPYGMTVAEGTDVDLNTRNNNNIVWKNISVEEAFSGLLIIGSTWIRSLFPAAVPTRLEVRIPPVERANGLLGFGTLLLNLGPDLFQRWLSSGAAGQGVERVPGSSTTVQVTGTDAFLENIPLRPGEVQRIEVQFRLQKGYAHPQGRVFNVDLEQIGAPGKPSQFIGGQRFQFNFNQLALVPAGASWRYLDTGQFPGDPWRTLNYDDSNWRRGEAQLGYGEGDETTIIRSGPPGEHYTTTWFRHGFTLADVSIYRDLRLRLKADDGAVVYLNGVEIHRANLPVSGAITPETLASAPIEGLKEAVFYPVNVSSAISLLRPGVNVLAVEVHQVSRSSDDLSFDLELLANLGTAQFPPQVTVLEPFNGSLHLVGRSVNLAAEAIDPDGLPVSVAFYADGQLLGSAAQPPYTVVWTNPPPGRHQLAAVARDPTGLQGSAFATIQVLSNLPPAVAITSPASEAMFRSGEEVTVAANASDPNGTVQKVELLLRDHDAFGEGQRVGTDTSAPFTFQIPAPAPGHYVMTAVATDSQGLFTKSQPVHIEVVPGARPALNIRSSQGAVLIDWSPANAILEQAPVVTGPWQVVSNAVPPLRLLPQERGLFFRARSP